MSAPIVVGDVVIVGPVISDGPRYQLAPPGDVRGFDVRTGNELWTFHTVAQEGEFGNETWENGSWKYTGGANPWGIAHGRPRTGVRVRADRHADQRLLRRPSAGQRTCSPRACSVSTRVPAAASGTSSSCTTACGTTTRPRRRSSSIWSVDGKPVKAVAVVTKQAFTYVFDRVTGAAGLPDRGAAGAARHRFRANGIRRRSRSRRARRRSIDRASRVDDLIDFTPELRREAEAILDEYVYGPIFEPPTAAGDGKKGHDPDAGRRRRRQLARRGRRSGNGLAVRPVAHHPHRRPAQRPRSVALGLPLHGRRATRRGDRRACRCSSRPTCG